MQAHDDGAWFAPKRIGYGAGLPIAWQGWAVYGIFAAATIATAVLKPAWAPWVVLVLAVPLIAITARRTRGGWRWRSGG